jgi:hypothetical protein
MQDQDANLHQDQENYNTVPEPKHDNWNVKLPSIVHSTIMFCTKAPVYNKWQLLRPTLQMIVVSGQE